jgi:SAM-dependent methyltransferase
MLHETCATDLGARLIGVTVGRKLAARRVTAGSVAVEYVGMDGQSLPANSVDHALSTWTLCSIPDAERALPEIHRVLQPGGTLYFIERGRSPDSKVARWQDRLTPLQRWLASERHLSRPIDTFIAGSGLDVTRLENYYLRGPKPLGYS